MLPSRLKTLQILVSTLLSKSAEVVRCGGQWRRIWQRIEMKGWEVT